MPETTSAATRDTEPAPPGRHRAGARRPCSRPRDSRAWTSAGCWPRAAWSRTTRASSTPRAARRRSPTSTATPASCATAATRSTSWPSTSSFAEVSYLLIYGELPTAPQLGRLHREDQPAHPAARGPQGLLRRLPAQRAPDAGAVLRGVRAVDVLRGLARPGRPGAARAADAAAAGQAADDRGVRVQEVDRAAVPLPGQLARPGGELPADDLRAAGRAVRGRPGGRARPGHAVHPARRPRAELLDRHRAAGRLGPGQPVRLRLGRHPRAVRAAARRGQPGGHRDARAHPGRRRATSTRSCRR